MDFNQLKYFLAAENYRSFNKAAKYLGIAQQSLSSSIKSLEKEMDAPLFVRTSKGVVLTPDGIEFKRFAQGAWFSYTEMMAKRKEAPAFERQRLSVGAADTLCIDFLPSFIVGFSQTFPHIDLKIFNLQEREIEERVREGALDCGIVFKFVHDCEKPDDSGEVKMAPIAPCRLYYWMSAQSPLAAMPEVSQEQVSAYPMALREYFDPEVVRAMGSLDDSRVFDFPLATETKTIVEAVARDLAMCPDLRIGARDLFMQDQFARYPVVAKPVKLENDLRFEVAMMVPRGGDELPAFRAFSQSLMRFIGAIDPFA